MKTAALNRKRGRSIVSGKDTCWSLTWTILEMFSVWPNQLRQTLPEECRKARVGVCFMWFRKGRGGSVIGEASDPKPGAMLTRVRVLDTAKGVSPRVNFSADSLTVPVRPPCISACISICVHVKNPNINSHTIVCTEEILHTHCQEWVALLLRRLYPYPQ